MRILTVLRLGYKSLGKLLSGTGRRMSYYAVAKGRIVGVYVTWAQCREQVIQFKGAIYKKFPTLSAAEEFIKAHNGSSNYNSSSSFNPQDTAVSLGSTTTCTPSKVEFWPEPNGDIDFEEDENVSKAELLAAMDEVEGLEAESVTIAKKRKLDMNIQKENNKAIKLESIILEPAGIKSVGAFDFFIDDTGHVIVYTDGSCINNGKPSAVAGFGVFFGHNHPLNAAKPVTGRVTNNVGEIQAAIYAIKIVLDLGIKKLCVNTDSQFLINAVTLWVNGWKRRNWRLSNGEAVKNVVDFKELDELLKSNDIDVKWNYVKAHSGIKGNIMADMLAREGAALYGDMRHKKK